MRRLLSISMSVSLGLVWIGLLSGCGAEATLYEAARDGDVTTARQLLEEGVSPNETDELGATPLVHASFQGHGEVVELLLDHGANVNYQKQEQGWGEGATALHMAAHRGHADIVAMLLEREADSNLRRVEPPYHNVTPLHDAVRSGQLEITELLIAAGAEVNAEAERDLSDVVPPDMQHMVESDERFTPLYFVRYVRDDGVADALEELLIDHGGTT